jgi:hypothetical protein
VTNAVTRWAGAGIRGGSGVVWGNTWSGVSHGVVVSLEDPPPEQPRHLSGPRSGNPYDLYVWNNISSGDDVYKNPTSNPRGIDYWLMPGRDYFTTAKPGYKPYTYPHPLRSTN